MAAADSVSSAYPSDPALPQPGDVIASKYRIEGLLGTGGMGVVLSAKHMQLGQSVAIKLLTTGLGDERREEAIARFLREGQAAAALQTDHVVRVYDVGTLDSGAPFMVMELLRGADLGQILETAGRLPVAEAVEYVLQACDAIAHAHDHGIVHRDLKPSNLFVSARSDGTPHVKVLDFGISKALNANPETHGSLTATRTVLGSPFYMSPEQLRDAKNTDHRTDIWALGVILHELLSGTPAFEGETLPGVAAAIAADPPARIRSLRPDVPEELETTILRCLEKQAKHRYQSVRELADVLIPFGMRRERQNVRVKRAQASTTSTSGRKSEISIADAQTVSLGLDQISSSDEWKATLQSGGISQSGERSIPAAPAADPTSTPGKTLSKSPRKRGLVVLAVGCGLLIASAFFLQSLRKNPEARATETRTPSASTALFTAPTKAPATAFNLIVESNPNGAEVREGSKSMGLTPLQLRLENQADTGQTRTFTVTKAGYLPYTIVQSDSESDVRIIAALVPEPTAPAASVAPAVSTNVTVSRAPRARVAKPIESARPKPAPVPPSDIRMQR